MPSRADYKGHSRRQGRPPIGPSRVATDLNHLTLFLEPPRIVCPAMNRRRVPAVVDLADLPRASTNPAEAPAARTTCRVGEGAGVADTRATAVSQ